MKLWREVLCTINRNNRTLKNQYEKFRKNYWKERAKSFKKGIIFYGLYNKIKTK
ncbi:HNH/ENDO VII family nuclease [Fusobacterium sp.]|uniref:HNH/ENDO VII family nuclease n=1 Tax=Fusobacterium sp. TaxID=68766 RepID=UPI003457F933